MEVSGAVAGIGSQQQESGNFGGGAGFEGSAGDDSSGQQQHFAFLGDSADANEIVGSQQHQPTGNAIDSARQYTRN